MGTDSGVLLQPLGGCYIYSQSHALATKLAVCVQGLYMGAELLRSLRSEKLP